MPFTQLAVFPSSCDCCHNTRNIFIFDINYGRVGINPEISDHHADDAVVIRHSATSLGLGNSQCE